jgi:hypothetical protein
MPFPRSAGASLRPAVRGLMPHSLEAGVDALLPARSSGLTIWSEAKKSGTRAIPIEARHP